ncbi:hypothetical protein GCM10007304_17550 [Rhodococcoides trifolii]|uniref:Uncharacterized protein n=1 Tax=Rhodococcoides trifolii TaxID=908250 RepID=A0A917CYT8_9NOCA|nr:hypothetical protein [Rhodococcus trifolii]GGG03886.1 hypothetical protein GCM10007304_17550 [Rhodococcus trifolii]
MALKDDVAALPTTITGGTTIGINNNAVVIHRALQDLAKLLGSSTIGASLVTAASASAARDVLDLAEYIQDTVAGLLKAGAGVTTTYDDAANTFTINATTGGGSTDPEVVRDTIGGALVAGSGVSITVNDAGDTITIAAAGVPASALTSAVQASLAKADSAVQGTGTNATVVLTQAAYTALATKLSTTTYLIVG